MLDQICKSKKKENQYQGNSIFDFQRMLMSSFRNRVISSLHTANGNLFSSKLLNTIKVFVHKCICIRRFVYSFKARTTGTMFYHSHVSFQRGDGMFGPYIVRRAQGKDPNEHLYDYDLTEHYIFPQEWFHAVIMPCSLC